MDNETLKNNSLNELRVSMTKYTHLRANYPN